MTNSNSERSKEHDVTLQDSTMTASPQDRKTIELVNKNLAKRYRAEKRFRAYGIASIGFGLLCLLFLFSDIIGKGHSAFLQTYVKLNVSLSTQALDISDINDPKQIVPVHRKCGIQL